MTQHRQPNPTLPNGATLDDLIGVAKDHMEHVTTYIAPGSADPETLADLRHGAELLAEAIAWIESQRQQLTEE